MRLMAEAVRVLSKSSSFAEPAAADIAKLQCMVQTAGHDRNLGTEPALDLVGDREGEQEVRTAGADVLGNRQYRAEVVCGMAETARRQERVEQVGIAHQHGVEERGLINRGASATDERRRGAAAELLGVRADWFDELSIECAHGTGDAVEHVPLQRPHSCRH